MKKHAGISWNPVFSLAVLSALLFLPQPGWSQEARGTIQGRVADPSGAVVAGAEIRVTHLATNQSRSTVSNNSGNYTLPLLPSGTYQITAEKQGFKRFSRAGIELDISGNVEVDIALVIGAATDTVTVTAESPNLETESASLGEVVDNRRISELPQPFNNEYLLMILSPGVVNGGGSQSRQQPWEPGSTVDINMAGSGNKTASITLDGANNSSRDTGSGALVPGFVPPSDAVEEFKVQTVSFDGTTGSTMGGTMNVSLKSGTNKLHATAYYSGVPQDWTANTFFNNKNGKPRSPSQTKRWGGSVNGPVEIPKLFNGRNRTFFMYAYESTDYASPQPATGNVATAAQRKGDFSDLLALGGAYQIYNPFSRSPIAGGRFQETPIAGNIIPPSLISPIATALINPKNYPLPNNIAQQTIDGGNNYYTNASQTVKFTTHTWRFDHNFNQNTKMFLNLHKSDATYQLPQWLGADSLYVGDSFGYKMSGFGLDVSHIFSPSLIMDARVSDSRYIRISDASPLPGARGIDLTAAYGFPAYYNNLFDPAIRRTPNVSIAGYGGYPGSTLSGAYDSLLWYPQENRSAAVSFVKTKGINIFKYGFEYRQVRQAQYSYGGSAEGGSFTFDTTYTQGPLDNSVAAPSSRGQGFAAFLMDVPSGGSYQVADSYYEQSTFYGLYFQDDIKVNRKLTLNLSLRYELEGPTTERFNRSVRNFNAALTHSGGFDALALAAYAKSPIAEMPVSSFSTLGGAQYAGVNGVSRELFQRDTNNFMPRIGFAYNFDAKTVFRGGFGVYFGPLGVDRGDVNPLNFNQTTNLISTNNSGLNFIASMANPYPSGVLQPFRSSLGADTFLGQGLGTLYTPNPEAPKVEKVSFDIQRALPFSIVMDVGYAGSFSSDLATGRNLKFIPSQYLSRLPSRDQAVINYWSSNVPNPFAGLLPGTSLNSTSTTPTALVQRYPQFTSLGVQTYEGFNSYHAISVELRRRFSRGFTGQIAYTHERQMDSTSFLHPDDVSPQKVISSQDFPNHIGSSVIYELPFGHGKMLFGRSNVANYVLGGWQLSAIWQYQTGAPLGFGDPIFSGDLKSALNISTDQRNTNLWFNAAGPGFNTVSAQQFGNHYQVISPRFSWFRAPSQDQVDMSLLKNTKVREKYDMQFRFDALNAFNHVWLAGPNTSPTSSSFGQITSENSRSRAIQFLVKFIY